MGVRDGFDEITALQKEIDSAMADLDFEKDTRFHPHYTLARVKFITEREKISKYLKEYKDLRCGEYTADRILLMESKLSPRGPEYSVVREYHLRKQE